MENKNICNLHKIIFAVTVSQSISFFEGVIPDLERKGYEVVSVSSSGLELQRLKGRGVKVIEVPMERRVSVLKDFRSILRLIKVFRKERPLLVHSMTPKAGLLCMMAAKLTRVPKRVHTFTGLVWPTSTGLTRRILMFTDWLTCVCATHIIPEGVGVMNDLQNHITNKPMRVLGYGNVRGVNMTYFNQTDEVIYIASSIRKKGIFSFLYVGRIVGDKGVNELIKAFSELHLHYISTRLILVGKYEDTLDPISKESKEEINSNKGIEYVGPQSSKQLLAYYAASDCFVLPSYREGFPNTVLEAGAMGLPSIVTDINGSREIILDGKNGLIVPLKDVAALENAMEIIIKDTELTRSLADNSREMIEARFEQGFVRKCLLDFYDEITTNLKQRC